MDRNDLTVLLSVMAVAVLVAVSIIGFAAAIGFSVRVFQWVS